MHFARKLESCIEGILTLCRRPLGTSLIEDGNSNIEVMWRIADGFRDDARFFLKTRAAIPRVG